jgi:NAD(P)-dependent dehydrogenase (short-subunit alcohol dehydrogenase family)
MSKTVLVTGANGGIGLATSFLLASQGAQVIMVCRNQERGQKAQIHVAQETGNKPDLFLTDMSLPKEIRKLAGRIKKDYSRLDILINLAGTSFKKRELTEDGLEKTFALNHLGYFVLSLELIDLLKHSTPSRIVNVTSSFYRRGKIDFDNLQGEQRYSYFGAYANSKLANVMFTYELAKRLLGSGVAVNCLNPGPIRTASSSATPFEKFIITNFGWIFLKKPDVAARLIVYLATSPDVEGITGKFLEKNYKFTPTTKASYDEGVAKELWEVSEQLAGR